jgi:hypothetical protein
MTTLIARCSSMSLAALQFASPLVSAMNTNASDLCHRAMRPDTISQALGRNCMVGSQAKQAMIVISFWNVAVLQSPPTYLESPLQATSTPCSAIGSLVPRFRNRIN